MYAIIGSGFGLYGYLPAIVNGKDKTVVLPCAYESKVRARTELAFTLPHIRWVDDEITALSMASTVVIAVPPQRQFELVSRCLTLPLIEKFVLEKPLAVTPALAAELVSNLDLAKKRYRVAYTLLNTTWHQRLTWPKLSTPDAVISINWTFMAHHFASQLNNWKRLQKCGGGVLRFYGVHLVALLAYHGYDDVCCSVLEGKDPREPECWNAIFNGPGLPYCHVLIDSKSATKQFIVVHRIAAKENAILEMIDPFDQEIRKGDDDARVSVIKRLIDSFENNDRFYTLFYKRVNTLWQKIETASLVKII
jgi:predicted dehydrogenase